MKYISLAKWIQWKRERRNTLIAFIIVGTIVAIDYSFMFITLYHYLKDVIKTEKPELYYGLVIAGYHLSSSLFGVFVGRRFDRYSNVKVITNATLIMQLLGISFYVIPHNIAYPFVGRLISGVGDPYVSICSREVIRIYNEGEGVSALWWLTACYSFGYVIAPIVVIVFHNVDFNIGVLHFNQLNTTCIMLAGLLIVALFVVNFLIHDCSAMKIYLKESSILNVNDKVKSTRIPNEKSLSNDISEASCLLNSLSTGINNYSKEDTPLFQKEKNVVSSYSNMRNGDEACIDVSDNSENLSMIGERSMSTAEVLLPIKFVFYNLLTNANTIHIFTSTLILAYSLFAVDVILPLFTEIVLEWSLTTLAIIFAANGIAYFVMILITWEFCVTDRTVYYMLMLSIISLILTFGIVILLDILKNNVIASFILMISFVILWAVSWIMEHVLIRCTLAKMVPSSCRSFTEVLRNGVSRLSMILAAITVPLCIPYFNDWCAGVITINLLLFIVFLIRRKSFLFVREMEFRSNNFVSTKRGNVPTIY